jgi:hypothetical protein
LDDPPCDSQLHLQMMGQAREHSMELLPAPILSREPVLTHLFDTNCQVAYHHLQDFGSV